jgi:hypothetical protein
MSPQPIPDRLSTDSPQFQGDSGSRAGRFELAGERDEGFVEPRKDSQPGVLRGSLQRVDDFTSEGSGNVEAREWSQLFQGDFSGEGSLNAQRTDDDVGKHGTVRQGLDGMAVGGKGATEICGLLQFAEKQLDLPGAIRR